MNINEKQRLAAYLNGEAMDERCNCGVDHGSKDANVAPSAVEGDETAERPADGGEDETVSAEDAAARAYLAAVEDEDGTPYKK